jgi:predicted transcriptional regulator
MAGNQHQPDPRQQLFLTHYIDPKSETFSNALQSALKAGYSEEYANNITGQLPDWLSDALGDNKRLKKAEKLLDSILDMQAVDQEGKVDNALISNQVKVATLYAKGLGKAKYSERVEQTGKDGGAIEVTTITGMKIVKE